MMSDDLEKLLAKPTCSVPEAGSVLGMAKNASYEAAHRGQFPLPVIRIGRKMRVATAGLRRLLAEGNKTEQPSAIRKIMKRGKATWTYDDDAGAWYFALSARAKPPHLKQRRVEAIIDLDADGRLAGVELLEPIEPSTRKIPE